MKSYWLTFNFTKYSAGMSQRFFLVGILVLANTLVLIDCRHGESSQGDTSLSLNVENKNKFYDVFQYCGLWFRRNPSIVWNAGFYAALLLTAVLMYAVGKVRNGVRLKFREVWKHFVNLCQITSLFLVAGLVVLCVIRVYHDFVKGLIVRSYRGENYDSDSFMLNIYNPTPPYYQIYVGRHVLEDICVEYTFNVTWLGLNDDWLCDFMASMWWMVGNEKLEETDRIHIKTSFLKYNAYEAVIKSTLLIELLEVTDFGRYSFGYSRTTKEVVEPISDSYRFDWLQSLFDDSDNPKFSSYMCNPRKIMASFSEIFAKINLQQELGSFMHIHSHFLGSILITPLKIPKSSESLQQKLLENDLKNLHCCSTFSLIYWLAMQGSHSLVARCSAKLNKKYTYFRQECLCPEDFIARRNTTRFRIRFNAVQNKHEFYETYAPEDSLLVPMNQAYCNKTLNLSLWLNERSMDCSNGSFSDECMEKRKYMDALWADILETDYIIQLTVLLLFAITAWHCYMSMSYLLPPIIVPLRHFFNYLKRGNQQHYPFRYDIYLTYDEEDKYETILAQRLQIVAKHFECRIFDTCRDILPGRMRDLECEKAISESRGFIIVASATFRDEPENVLELSAIKRTVAERRLAGHVPFDFEPVFVVETQKCDIGRFCHAPYILLPEDECTCGCVVFDDLLFDWFEQVVESIKCENLKNFSLSGKLRLYGFSYKSAIAFFVLACLLMYCFILR